MWKGEKGLQYNQDYSLLNAVNSNPAIVLRMPSDIITGLILDHHLVDITNEIDIHWSYDSHLPIKINNSRILMIMRMSNNMRNTMIGRFSNPHNLLNNYHQINFSSLDIFLWIIIGQWEISYKWWSDPRHVLCLTCIQRSPLGRQRKSGLLRQVTS